MYYVGSYGGRLVSNRFALAPLTRCFIAFCANSEVIGGLSYRPCDKGVSEVIINVN